MIYDPNSNEIILFGGIIKNGDHSPLPSIWRFSFINNTWRKITPELSPSPRFNHKMLYIPSNHTIMLFGGLNTTNHAWLGDTWFFSPQTNEWVNKNPDVSPPKRSDVGLAYDLHNHQVLLFGGFQSGLLYEDLWEYNIDMNNWTELSDINNPSARYGPSLIYNNMSKMSYLFGGNSFIYSNDLFCYNQSSLNWSLVPSSTLPPARYWHSMSFVNHLNIGFLFGGTNTEILGDTWFFNFNSSEWLNQSTLNSPSPRLLSGMIYNNYDKKIYLYGGLGGYSIQNYDDLWTFNFDSNRWAQIQSSLNTSPFLLEDWWAFVLIAIVGAGCIIGYLSLRNRRN
jgi:N-acetylneuraminic acid mutarotase